MFIPGETIAQTFTLPYSKENIGQIIVSYRQRDRIILEKIITSQKNMQSTDDDQTVISAVLSESESLLFENDCDYGIQINIFFGSGEVTGGRVASCEITGHTGYQHIRELSTTAAKAGLGSLYIDDDGCLIWSHDPDSDTFAIDSDGFLVIERKVV